MRVLALDVGSSSTRACAYDERGRELGECAQPDSTPREPRADGSAELDADELVPACGGGARRGGAAADATRELLLLAQPAAARRARGPLTPVLLWQDRRAAAQAEELRGAARPAGGARPHRLLAPPELLAGEARVAGRAGHAGGGAADGLVRRLPLSPADRASCARRSRPPPAAGCSTCAPGRGTASCSTELGLGEELLPPLSDEPVGTSYPPLGDGACSNLGSGCMTPDRAALMIGTSGAYRVVRSGEPAPREGLFCYLLDEAARGRGRRRLRRRQPASRGSSER